jgi:exodeoxyribonuclease VII large subunit
MNPQGLRLSELNKKIKAALQLSFPDSVWVIGEISDLKLNNSGHCYLEMIEKDPQSDYILAKQKAIIWSYTFRMLSPYFESSTGYKLTAGLKILVNVHLEYHEVYGISLIIKDIEPSYTLGDLAARKREIILRLQEEGVIEMNRSIPLPMVPQRIAVISSETAAGYGDFQSSLHKNIYGFSFYTQLFPAVMQGEKAEGSIIEALDKIFEIENDFDVVVIIRGGGAASDLECFNNYNLAYHITQFPIPIITGIGHERDETITDIVAHTSLKTPTAVAEFLIDTAIEFKNLIDSLENRFITLIRNHLTIEQQKLALFTQNLNITVINTIQNKSIWIQSTFQRLGLLIRQFRNLKSDRLDNYTYLSGIYSNFIIRQGFTNLKDFKSNLHRKTFKMIQLNEEKLNVYERNINYLDPLNVLRRGFSITVANGKLIKDSSYLKEGDELLTSFHKGNTKSVVIKK